LRATTRAPATLVVIGCGFAMRRGWFRISCGFDASDLLGRLSLIARITTDGYEVVVAESDMFERLKPGDLAPEYFITVNTHRNEAAERFEFSYAATRVR
jgi:hypothetical protein